MTSEKSYTGWYFLLAVLVAYGVTFIIAPDKVSPALSFAANILGQLVPVFVLIIGVSAVMNYYIKPNSLARYMGKESGARGWIITTVSGILSTGPIYMWYPLLSELKKHGVRDALLANFLYNRAVKIPLMPLLIFYFGVKYAAVLTFVTVFLSFIAGWLTEKILEVTK